MKYTATIFFALLIQQQVTCLTIKAFQQGIANYYGVQQLSTIALFYQQPLDSLSSSTIVNSLDPVTSIYIYQPEMGVCQPPSVASNVESVAANWYWKSPFTPGFSKDPLKYLSKNSKLYNYIVLASLYNKNNAAEFLKVGNHTYTKNALRIISKLVKSTQVNLKKNMPKGACPPSLLPDGLTYNTLSLWPGGQFELYGFSQWQSLLNTNENKYSKAVFKYNTYVPPVLIQMEALMIGAMMFNAAGNGVVYQISPVLSNSVAENTKKLSRLYANHTKKLEALRPASTVEGDCETQIAQNAAAINNFANVCSFATIAVGAGSSLYAAALQTAGAAETTYGILGGLTSGILQMGSLQASGLAANLVAFIVSTITTAIFTAAVAASAIALDPFAFALVGLNIACGLLGTFSGTIARAETVCSGICASTPSCQLTSAGCIQDSW